MACHEIAALRLGLMNVLGLIDEAEKQHELAELGTAADQPGPLQFMCQASTLTGLKHSYEASLSVLEEKVANTDTTDPQLPYLRTLIVLTKKVELDLTQQLKNLTQLFLDLEQMHDFVHEIYPAD